MMKLVLAIEGEWAVVGVIAVILPLLPNHMMHQFPGAQGLVTVLAKMIHDRSGVFQYFVAIPFSESEATRVVWIDACEKARPRGAADRNIAVSLSERDSTMSKSSHVRCLRLWMPAKTLDVVIQVITDYQNNIGPGCCRSGLSNQQNHCRYKEFFHNRAVELFAISVFQHTETEEQRI